MSSFLPKKKLETYIKGTEKLLENVDEIDTCLIVWYNQKPWMNPSQIRAILNFDN